MIVGVIGAVDFQVLGSQIRLAIPRIDNRGVNVQIGRGIAPVKQTVVDDRRDGRALLIAGGFLFDHGGNDHQVVHRQLMGGDILFASAVLTHHIGNMVVQNRKLIPHLLGKPGIEVIQHLFQNISGRVVLVEFIGIREQIPLQTVKVAPGNPLQEPIVLQLSGSGVGTDVHKGTDLILLHKLEYLTAGVALRDGQLHNRAGRTGRHHFNQSMVVIAGVEIPDAGANLPFIHREAGV